LLCKVGQSKMSVKIAEGDDLVKIKTKFQKNWKAWPLVGNVSKVMVPNGKNMFHKVRVGHVLNLGIISMKICLVLFIYLFFCVLFFFV